MLHRAYSRRAFCRLLSLGGGIAALSGVAAVHQATSAAQSATAPQAKGHHLSQKEWSRLD